MPVTAFAMPLSAYMASEHAVLGLCQHSPRKVLHHGGCAAQVAARHPDRQQRRSATAASLLQAKTIINSLLPSVPPFQIVPPAQLAAQRASREPDPAPPPDDSAPPLRQQQEAATLDPTATQEEPHAGQLEPAGPSGGALHPLPHQLGAATPADASTSDPLQGRVLHAPAPASQSQLGTAVFQESGLAMAGEPASSVHTPIRKHAAGLPAMQQHSGPAQAGQEAGEVLLGRPIAGGSCCEQDPVCCSARGVWQ